MMIKPRPKHISPFMKDGHGYGVTIVPSNVGGSGAVSFVVSCGGLTDEPKATLTLYLDGCLNLKFHPPRHIKDKKTQDLVNGFMYADVARGVAHAFELAFKEKARRRRAQERANTQAVLDEFLGEHYRKTLDLNRTEARKVMAKCRWRKRSGGGVEIYYDKAWRHLCRTDLKDDVRTWTQWSSCGTQNHMKHYAGTVAYGARVTPQAFYIVDAFSDG